MKACFMGLGYIGLPTAIIAAKHGVQVTGVDINPKVVELTNQDCLNKIIETIKYYQLNCINLSKEDRVMRMNADIESIIKNM